MQQNYQKNKNDLITSFRLLGSYLQQFEEGKFFFYLPISVELRKLLCDTKDRKPSSLLNKVLPDAKLPKLHFTKIINGMPSLLNKLEHFMPGELITTQDGVMKFQLLYADPIELIDIDTWIEQLIFKDGITIRELIKAVADKILGRPPGEAK